MVLALWFLLGATARSGIPPGAGATSPPEPFGPGQESTGKNIAFRLLALEAELGSVSPEEQRFLSEWLDEAERRIRSLGLGPAEGWGRPQVLAAFAEVDATMVSRGWIYPADGRADSLSAALRPFHLLSEAERGAFLARAENERRAAMMAGRGSGPFRAADCDTGSFLYLGLAERIGWPLRLVIVPSRDREPGHAFVRWRSGSRAVDWETTTGRERTGRETAGGPSRDSGRRPPPWVECELVGDQVLACGHYLLGVHRERRGDGEAALAAFEAALKAFPEHGDARRRFAWNTATLPKLSARDLPAALKHARALVERCGDADAHDTLAAVHAAAGDFERAVSQERAALAQADLSPATRAAYRRRLDLYRRGEAYRQP